jgi:hypothetical protein
LKDIAERLDKVGIRYMLTGSVALALYAAPRMTRALDIVIDIGAGDAARVASLFETNCYIDRDEVEDAARRRGMFNAIHRESLIKVDCIVRKDEPYRNMEFSRRLRIDLEGAPLWVVAPEDLLLSKLLWARDAESQLQMKDAFAIAASVRGLDWKYVFEWADALGVRDLAEKVKEG